MILAGNIGGTNTRLGLFELNEDRITPVVVKTYPSRDLGLCSWLRMGPFSLRTATTLSLAIRPAIQSSSWHHGLRQR